MKNKKLIIIVMTLIASTSVIAYGNQTRFFQSSLDFVSSLFGQSGDNEIPNEILYDTLFRIVDSLKKKSGSPGTNPEKASGMANYFKNKANLTIEENQTLQKTALEYIQAVTSIDEQARTIIENVRRNILNGEIPKDQPPPPELDTLQRQRNDLALQYRDNLQTALGQSGFAKLEQFVNGYFLSHFHKTPASSFELEQEK